MNFAIIMSTSIIGIILLKSNHFKSIYTVLSRFRLKKIVLRANFWVRKSDWCYIQLDQSLSLFSFLPQEYHSQAGDLFTEQDQHDQRALSNGFYLPLNQHNPSQPTTFLWRLNIISLARREPPHLLLRGPF